MELGGKGINYDIYQGDLEFNCNRKKDTPCGPKNDPVVSPTSSEQKRRGNPEIYA